MRYDEADLRSEEDRTPVCIVYQLRQRCTHNAQNHRGGVCGRQFVENPGQKRTALVLICKQPSEKSPPAGSAGTCRWRRAP
jgi:hypothetical protein